MCGCGSAAASSQCVPHPGQCWGDGTGIRIRVSQDVGLSQEGGSIWEPLFSSETLTPHLFFPPREAVQLTGAGAAEIPLLPEAALPGEVMLVWWGHRGSPRAGCPPHTAVTLGLLPTGGQGPGARVCEPGGVDMPDQSGGRG